MEHDAYLQWRFSMLPGGYLRRRYEERRVVRAIEDAAQAIAGRLKPVFEKAAAEVRAFMERIDPGLLRE